MQVLSTDMRPHAFTAGETVEDMLRKDLVVEHQARANLRAAMTLCEKHQDFQTRALLLAQLKDTQKNHAYWLEKQLGLSWA